MKPNAKIVLEFKEMSMTLTVEEAKELYNILHGLVGEKKEDHTHIHYDQHPYHWLHYPYTWTSANSNWNIGNDPNKVTISYLNDAVTQSNTQLSHRPDGLE